MIDNISCQSLEHSSIDIVFLSNGQGVSNKFLMIFISFLLTILSDRFIV